MGKVIPFKARESRETTVAKKLVAIANDIDSIILESLRDPDIDPKDLVGLLSHRTGTLLSHVDGKSELWDVCAEVVKKQAKISDL